ncbi:alpha/beta fold hydrolase [Herbiconiux sp. YIM B11900]|uniref:alpha/beta fold hydrolase n=1 Tax=Herbiconiux sp. YIM B11900 TaxID=3404131 RepID=UPI003F824B35
MDFASNPADGSRIAYRSIGEGTPVVLLHGTALSQAIWRGFGYLRALGGSHRVITLDLRGHGRSDKPHTAASYGIDLFVGDVIAVLDALGVPAAHVVGYSLGARVALAVATAHPERVRSLASVAGAPGTGVGVFDRVFFDGAITALEHGGMAGFLAAWERASGHPVDAATRMAFEANDAAALAAYMREAERLPRVTDAELAALPMPVLLLAGTRDRERLTAMEHLRAQLPHAEWHVLDGATHADTPRHPQTLPLLEAFVDRVDAGKTSA